MLPALHRASGAEVQCLGLLRLGGRLRQGVERRVLAEAPPQPQCQAAKRIEA